MILTGKHRTTGNETRFSVTLSTTNLTWTIAVSNKYHRIERSARFGLSLRVLFLHKTENHTSVRGLMFV